MQDQCKDADQCGTLKFAGHCTFHAPQHHSTPTQALMDEIIATDAVHKPPVVQHVCAYWCNAVTV
ncbi:hypothetical protein T265_10970 [Opisthorchis viverrini]|uniref:Uncharacterized protein n=1 Tax=Opisthorchis viverrini TaxID=6198 RepID=A0A074ZB81_OPIVI|nr:hypothetical protein T265_10970 [Opisthorchis viverrini]KER20485.1 hypothetical protein T265_10970 [Opisthorchis viverrini]